jgi:8-oxo-dGTP diphosphatase
MDKKVIRVTCAIIERNGKILAAQRSERMGQPLKWEFPGGKVENDEEVEDCISREIKEELEVDISVVKRLRSHVHSYENMTIELIPFICNILSGEIVCKEHKEIVWGNPVDMEKLDWAGADIPVYKEYMECLKNSFIGGN